MRLSIRVPTQHNQRGPEHEGSCVLAYHCNGPKKVFELDFAGVRVLHDRPRQVSRAGIRAVLHIQNCGFQGCF